MKKSKLVFCKIFEKCEFLQRLSKHWLSSRFDSAMCFKGEILNRFNRYSCSTISDLGCFDVWFFQLLHPCTSETGWDPAPFAGILYCRAHTWTNISSSKRILRKKKKNYKGLKITACIGSWGKLWATRQKRPKNQLLLLRFWEQQQLLRMIPARGTTRGWWTTSATLLAQPLDCPHPRLIWGTYSPPLREQAREVVTCFCCLLLQPKSQ